MHDHPLIVFADYETFQKDRRMTGVAKYSYKIVSQVPGIESSTVLKRGSADDFVMDMQALEGRYRKCIKGIVPLKKSTVRGEGKACYACGEEKKKASERSRSLHWCFPRIRMRRVQ